ncbi:MAG: hypothetical protein QOI86_1453 [Actinomycetota bacterium]|nr:hypothetical protein [Actinomycetota bacterium]
MRRTPRSRTILAAGAALFLAAAALVTAAAPAAAAGPVRVMQFNMCGAMCNHGAVDKAGAGNDVVDDVRGRVTGFQPAVLTLNEVCVAQFNRLKALLGGGPWKMSGAFRSQRDEPGCGPGGAQFGDAVFTAGATSGQKVLGLPNPSGPGGEHRAVLCVRTAAGGGPLLACVLHTVTGNPLKARQVAAAARALNGEAAHSAVIVGGDFNTDPGGMRALLDSGQGGHFFDVDPQKASTRGGKIDYVLFDRGHFSNPSGGPQGSKYSDHGVLLGQATHR